LALLKEGRIFKYGTKEEVLTSQNLSETFGVSVELGLDGERYFVKSIR
jgi:ABC-type cobalamin/Fe3+-siderophores transport system ATPase subunit